MPLTDYESGMHIDNALIRSTIGLPVWFTVLGWFITIINIIANSVLIFVIRKHFLDSVQYWLTLSLATADLLIGVSIFPSIFFCNISDTVHCDWHLQLFVYSSLIYVSVSSVAVTIFGYYIILVFPLRYASLMTSSRVWKTILISWVMPLSLGLLPLAWENLRKKTVLNETEKYFVFTLVIFEVVPFCVFSWIAIHLIKIVRIQKNKIHAQCNVHGRLSPPPVRKSFDVRISRDVNEETSCEVTEISTKQDNAFFISNKKLPDDVNHNCNFSTTTAEQLTSASNEGEKTSTNPTYLYSLNNWLPSLHRKSSSDTRTSLDMSEFPSSFSLSNPKELLNRLRVRQFRDEHRRTVLISCLLVLFMLCYVLTLANASCVFSNYCNKYVTSTDFKIITLFFELLNSAFNPLLFMLLGKDLRRKVVKLLFCKK